MDRPSSLEIRNHLTAICSSETFSRSPQGKRVLRYLIDATLRENDSGSFKGAVIGVEIFGLHPGHDPRHRSIVRVTVAKLRETLARYYETEGLAQPVRISIAPGSYVPDISYDPVFASSALDPTSAMDVANAKALMDRRTPAAYAEAQRYLGMAMERQPGHPRLLSLTAMVHIAVGTRGAGAPTAFETARLCTSRAREDGREPWELPLVEAWLAMKLEFDWEKADRLFNRAIELNAAEARRHTWYTAFLASQLRWPEFLTLVEDAVTGTGFNSAYLRGRLTFAQIVTGRFDDAQETLRQTFELFPNVNHTALLHRGLLREAIGDFRGATEAFEQVTEKTKDPSLAAGFTALTLGLAGERSAARELYEQLLTLRLSGEAFVPASRLGYACIGIGDFDGAVEWLTQAYVNECDPLSSWAAILPCTRHLRSHRAFISLVQNRLRLQFQRLPFLATASV